MTERRVRIVPGEGETIVLELLAFGAEQTEAGWAAYVEICFRDEEETHHVWRFPLPRQTLVDVCDDAMTAALTLLGGRAPALWDANDPGYVVRREWGGWDD